MTDWEKEKAERDRKEFEELKSFKSAMRDVVETTDTAICWLWAILIISVPVFLYFKPLDTSGTSQAILQLVLICFLLIVSVIWRALGKAK